MSSVDMFWARGWLYQCCIWKGMGGAVRGVVFLQRLYHLVFVNFYDVLSCRVWNNFWDCSSNVLIGCSHAESAQKVKTSSF